jgi:phospholipid/cholesterol/gamma-HCH transport system permease protein
MSAVRARVSAGRELPGVLGVGAVVRFVVSGVRGYPRALRYGTELVRQMAILATGSAMVLMFVSFLAGQSCGLESAYVARALSAPPLGPGAAFACSVVYIVPFRFGFVLAAKVGCGLVAELGAMRIREEIDAIDVLGINSMTYLVSVRMLASTLILPFLYCLSVASAELGAYVQSFIRFHDVSSGTYSEYAFSAFTPTDLFLSLGQGLVISTVVIGVALYLGYNVRGGPVEVGMATARSMGVSLVLVTLVNLIWVLLFLLKARVPIA